MSTLLLSLALAALSPSKIGVVVAGDVAVAPSTPGAQVLAACPRLVVYPLDGLNGSVVAQQGAALNAACPGVRIVLQVGGTGTPVNAAFAQNWLTPQPPQVLSWLQQVQQAGAGYTVAGVEGPWEPVGIGSTADVAAFWGAFAQAVSGSTFIPVVGALAPGPPSGIDTPADAFCATTQAVRNLAIANFAWSVHARTGPTPFASTDPALDFQRISVDCGLGGIPVYLTRVLPATGSWSAADLTWLASFDAALAQDPDAFGAALFSLGVAPDLTPIGGQLATFLANPVLPDGGVPDAGDGGSSSGVLPPGSGTVGGTLSPPKGGCSSTGAGLLALAALPGLFLLRRRTRRDQGVKR
jgi:hypothetical protein